MGARQRPGREREFETIDLADHGDDAVGYRTLWGTGGDYDRQDLMAVVRVGDVSLSLLLAGESIDEPAGGLPEGYAWMTVAHLEDGERASPVESPSTTTTSEAPSTTETGAIEVFPEGRVDICGTGGPPLEPMTGNRGSHRFNNS